MHHFFFCTPCSATVFFCTTCPTPFFFENKNGLVYYIYHKGPSPCPPILPLSLQRIYGQKSGQNTPGSRQGQTTSIATCPPDNTPEKQPAPDLPTQTRTGRPIRKATKGVEDLVERVKLSKNSEEENIASTDTDYIQTSSTAWDDVPDKYSEDDSVAYEYIEES